VRDIPEVGVDSIGSGSAVMEASATPGLAGSSVASRSVRFGASVEAEVFSEATDQDFEHGLVTRMGSCLRQPRGQPVVAS
jgi:hypothetical protein